VATIVVVEDNPDSMKLFRALLKRAGHTVREHSTGVGLADQLAADAALPDLVLLDIQLPDRDGFEVLTELRRRWEALKVVALTANATTDDRIRVADAGFDGLITKPIDVVRFPGQVAKAVAGERLDE
jgi:DNA-binding response OmpR family regulator